MFSSTSFAGRHILITGGTRGIGLATTEMFLAMGARVTVIHRSQSSSQHKLQMRFHGSGQLHYIRSDLGALEYHQPILQQAVALKQQNIDVAILNAGIANNALLGHYTNADIDQLCQVNLTANVHLSQILLQYMTQDEGSIVVNSSMAGLLPKQGNGLYSYIKAALNGFVIAFAPYCFEHKIRLNAVAPTFIDTDLIKSLSPSEYQPFIVGTALNKLIPIDHLTNIIAFLASPLSQAIIGEVVPVTGGLFRRNLAQ